MNLEHNRKCMNSTYSVLNVFLHECFETHPKTSYAAPNKDRSLTFRGGTGAVRDAGTSLWRAHALTAECQQPPDDSSLAGSIRLSLSSSQLYVLVSVYFCSLFLSSVIPLPRGGVPAPPSPAALPPPVQRAPAPP